LRLSGWVEALGGLGLLVAGFLPWYSAGGQDVTAWQAFSVTDILIALAAFFSLSVAISVVCRISVSYPVAGSTVAALFGAIALVLIVYRLINPPGDGLDLEYGAWIGLGSSLAAAYGGYLGMQPIKAPNASSAA
jgi:hypothetical protein